MQALRALIDETRRCDAPDDALVRARELIVEASALLHPYRYEGEVMQAALRGPNPLLDLDDKSAPSAYFPYSPIVGPRNPLSPLIDFQRKGDEMVATHVFDAPWNGPPGSVHGGVIALVFDELLGCIGAVSNVGGFTGTLKIIYRSLTPIGKPVRMRAWIDRTEGVKTFVQGTMHCDFPAPDTLCAEAEGIFIRPKIPVGQHALAQTGNR